MIRMIDSMSDGMCGYVLMEDTESGTTAQVRWSVTSFFWRSQSAAIEEASARLRRAAQIPRTVDAEAVED